MCRNKTGERGIEAVQFDVISMELHDSQAGYGRSLRRTTKHIQTRVLDVFHLHLGDMGSYYDVDAILTDAQVCPYALAALKFVLIVLVRAESALYF